MNQKSSINQSPSSATLPAAKDRNRPLFVLGRIVATPAVLKHFADHGILPDPYIRRHVRGDWGEVPAEDALENDFSVANGLRLLSAYEICGKRVWIITEADRSATTVLFPSEY